MQTTVMLVLDLFGTAIFALTGAVVGVRRKFDIFVYIGYMPLHSAPYGLKFGYKPEDLPITESIGSRVTRLPYYTAMADGCLDYVFENMSKVLKDIYGF